VHFGDEKYLERYHQYQAAPGRVAGAVSKLASVDMRYERQVVLEMQPGTAAPAGDAAPVGAAPARRPTQPAQPQATPRRQAAAAAAAHAASREGEEPGCSATKLTGQAGGRLPLPGDAAMNARQDNLITVLDAGSSKICVLVAELQDGVLRYRGHGIEAARGMRKGLIAELGPAAEAINKAALTAERVARAGHRDAVVGIGGTHVRGVNSRGGISLGSRMREITREEVRAAVDRARSVALPPDREVLHLLPQEFILDDQAGIHDPIGMVGNKLEVNLHLSTCSGGAAQSVVTCANRAGLEVADTIYEGIAAAESVLSADERELGVCVADIGSSTTELAVFFEGSIAHTAVLPIGGDHFTNDLAVGLHVSVEEAEELKRVYGNCVVTAVPQRNEIEVGGNLALGSLSGSRTRPRGWCGSGFWRRFWSRARASSSPCCATTCARAACWRRWARDASSPAAERCSPAAGQRGEPAARAHAGRLAGAAVAHAGGAGRPEFSVAIGMLLYTHRTQVRRARACAKNRGCALPS
jgi:cell division protein FtsA